MSASDSKEEFAEDGNACSGEGGVDCARDCGEVAGSEDGRERGEDTRESVKEWGLYVRGTSMLSPDKEVRSDKELGDKGMG